jgi:uracil-DNA glycosylase
MRTRTHKGETTSAADFIPPHADLHELAQASKHCRGCDLYKDATQTVFGEGPAHASIIMVGEQPGNMEDKKGRPFVGPAGGLLDRALGDAKIPREEVYVTNAVKHFRFFTTRHYRFHRNPSGLQINACRPWLEAEIAVIKPKVIVCMGAVAARSVMRRNVILKNERGVILPSDLGPNILITTHPSAILRMKEGRDEEYKRLVKELSLARKFLKRPHQKAA